MMLTKKSNRIINLLKKTPTQKNTLWNRTNVIFAAINTFGISIEIPAAKSDNAVTPSYIDHATNVAINKTASCATTILGIIRSSPLKSCQDYSRQPSQGQLIRSDFVAFHNYRFIFNRIPSSSSKEL